MKFFIHIGILNFCTESTFVNVTVPHTVLNAMDTDEGSTMKAYVNAVPKPKIEWLFEGEKLEKNPSFMQI